jgi:hypothetical protein
LGKRLRRRLLFCGETLLPRGIVASSHRAIVNPRSLWRTCSSAIGVAEQLPPVSELHHSLSAGEFKRESWLSLCTGLSHAQFGHRDEIDVAAVSF